MKSVDTAQAEMDVQVFAVAVYRYCQRVKGSVTSWIRTPFRNRSVGGVMRSLHLEALAVDVVLDAEFIQVDDRHLLAHELGLKLVVESDHDHLELKR